MAQGKAIPEVVHWIIIRLNIVMNAEEISMYTDVSPRKVKEILSYFKRTGEVNVSKRLYFTVPHGFPWTPRGLLIVLMESSWSPHGVLIDSS